MDKPVRASGVWLEALVIVVRHPAATVVPALFLGALTESPHQIPDPRSSLEVASAFVTVSSPSTSTWLTRSG
jgi:hypothetical protein